MLSPTKEKSPLSSSNSIVHLISHNKNCFFHICHLESVICDFEFKGLTNERARTVNWKCCKNKTIPKTLQYLIRMRKKLNYCYRSFRVDSTTSRSVSTIHTVSMSFKSKWRRKRDMLEFFFTHLKHSIHSCGIDWAFLSCRSSRVICERNSFSRSNCLKYDGTM